MGEVDEKAPRTIGHRFLLLNQLGKGGMGVVHRAQDRLTGDMVALKQVLGAQVSRSAVSDTQEHEELRLSLTREFKVLASLRHPNIITVIDYGFDDESPYFAMELLNNPASLLDAADDYPFAQRIDVIIQMLQALSYLHRQGVLHRDLKPQNVQVVDGQVKVLDFGLAILREQASTTEASGTFAYMAPEILLGEPAVEATDLYAVGIMAYELFTGHHPFAGESTAHMLTQVLNTRPDLSIITDNDPLTFVLERLLEKNPQDRYQTAQEVIEAFHALTNQPKLTESIAIRESFLQGARFVGREAELDTLQTELEKLSTGMGNAWLIGGESGVGKSRLIEELRIQALVKGIQVFRGQEISEGGNPYQPWREVLRRLCLYVDLSKAQASILKPLISDIETLLQQPVPDAPSLDASAAQDRLFITIEDAFRRNRPASLVILEDLHWSDNATLLLLNRLYRLTTTQPLFILVSYRHDERPNLPDNLPSFNALKLERFSEHSIEQLAISMLGQQGAQPSILRLLVEESGGNPYFVVEVVRALADVSGQLNKIGEVPLPKKIFPGGVKEIINHRLNRVPASALPLLQLAAVLGRQLDLALLGYVARDVDLDLWLETCASLAIVEVADAEWQFSQNKLRDGLIARLSADELKGVHQQAAEAIEAIYPNGKGFYAILAFHWEIAENSVKASHWYELAGYEAENSYDPESAIEYYQKALKYMPADSEKTAREMRIYGGLGKMLRWQTRFDEATDTYNLMRLAAEQLGDLLAQSQAWIGQSEVNDRRGDRKSALANAEQAETILRTLGEQGETLLADALGSKAWSLYRLKERAQAKIVAQEALALSERLNLAIEVARSQSLLGILSAISGELSLAREYMVKALSIARGFGDKRDVGIRLNNLGEVDKMRGDYTSAENFFGEAQLLFNEIGYRDAEIASLTNLAGVQVMLGHYELAERNIDSALKSNEDKDWWGLSETYRNLALTKLHHGFIIEALEAAQFALKEGKKAEIQEFVGKSYRVLGMVLGQLGESVEVDGQTLTADHCFTESVAILKQEGADVEQAYTLREWARYLTWNNQREDAEKFWNEARTLFEQNNIAFELRRMQDEPL